MPKIKLSKNLFYILFVLFFSCSKKEEITEIDNFYNESDTSASIDKLKGVWAIFEAKFDGELSEVPINYQSCGRDFFVYSDDGIYSEYLYQSSSCEPKINKLNWELNNGVISLQNSLGQTDDFVITKLNNEELVFKSRFDVNEDGVLDVLTVYAKKYEPNEPDLISGSFTLNQGVDFENLISFTWNPYEGFNQFDRYEIFRSVGDNCSKANAELVASITDAKITELTDLSPPAEERLCYFIKIYTEKGLLAESNLYDLTSDYIRIDPVSLLQPIVLNDQIELKWDKSDSPYFSHYEIVLNDNTTNTTPQEYTLSIINDKNVTSYTDLNPPYFKNPVYRVYVHNIFGNKSPAFTQDTTVFWEVPFKRKEILELNQIISFDIDPEEPVIYFYGRNRQEDDEINIHRFNYNTHQVESISNVTPNTYTEIPLKVFISPNGKEVVVNQGIELHFYDAVTMEFKYAVDPEEVFSISDFTYFQDLDLWIITDSDNVYTLKRENTNLRFIASQPHFSDHQGGGNYQPFVLQDNRLLVGHRGETSSMIYTLNANGTILYNQTVPIHLKNLIDDKMLLNSQGRYILDVSENRLYSTETFQFIESFEMPVFPSGTSINGQEVYGTNNDPNWQVTNESSHKKEAIIFNRNSGKNKRIETIGYPQVIFENYNGDIISISTGLKKNRLIENYYTKPSIFIENIPNL